MQINKKILLLSFFLLLIVLIILLIATNLCKNDTTIDAVMVTNTKINEDDSVSFILANYRKVPVDCSAVLEITQNSSIILSIGKRIGTVKPKQRIKEIISEFEMPGGLAYIEVLPNCTELE